MPRECPSIARLPLHPAHLQRTHGLEGDSRFGRTMRVAGWRLASPRSITAPALSSKRHHPGRHCYLTTTMLQKRQRSVNPSQGIYKRRGSWPADGPVTRLSRQRSVYLQPYSRGLSSAQELICELDSAFWQYIAQSPHSVGVAGLNCSVQSRI